MFNLATKGIVVFATIGCQAAAIASPVTIDVEARIQSPYLRTRIESELRALDRQPAAESYLARLIEKELDDVLPVFDFTSNDGASYRLEVVFRNIGKRPWPKGDVAVSLVLRTGGPAFKRLETVDRVLIIASWPPSEERLLDGSDELWLTNGIRELFELQDDAVRRLFSRIPILTEVRVEGTQLVTALAYEDVGLPRPPFVPHAIFRVVSSDQQQQLFFVACGETVVSGPLALSKDEVGCGRTFSKHKASSLRGQRWSAIFLERYIR